MAKENKDYSVLSQTIIQLTKNARPNNVQELVKLVEEEIAISESQIVDCIILLESQGKITLEPPVATLPQKLSFYLKTKEASWYWITLILTAATTITLFAISENAYPMIYIRHFLGLLFVIWLPGYSLTKALFPKQTPSITSSRSLDSIERLALSIGMSLALVPIVGFLLNYTPWGIRLVPIVFSLLVLTVVFATTGIIREYRFQRAQTMKSKQIF